MASSVIGALRVMLGMDTAEFETGIDRAQRGQQRFFREMEKTGRQMQRLGAGMTLALTAPLTAFGVSSFKAASDAAELQSAFDQTFGELAGGMNAWAEETGNAMGRSTQSMQQLANSFGLFFNNVAETRAEAAEMSKTFAVLAQDFASFHNLTEEQALDIFRSALAGEAEGMRRFGVDVSAAAVGARALEMGLAATTKELTEQDKVLARFNLIVEKTKNAQGDVARTSDGAANKARAFADAVQELQVAVGDKLLPVFTPLIAAATRALTAFANLPEPVQQFAIVAAGLTAALGPVIGTLGTLMTLAPQIAAAFGIIRVAALALMAHPVIFAFSGVIAGIYAAWLHWDKIEPILRRLYEGVKRWLGDNLGAILKGVLNPIGAVTEGFRKMYVAVVGNSYVPDMVTQIGVHMARLQGLMVEPAQDATGKTTDAMADMAEAAGDLAQDAELQTVRVADTFQNMTDRALGALRSLSDGIKGGDFFSILEGVVGVFTSLGSFGAFGSKIQAGLQQTPGFANGGAMRLGGFGGVDRNVLSLNGSPIARVSAGETMQISPAGAGGRMVVNNYYTLPSEEFWGRVDGRAAGVVAQAAPDIARAGSGMAMERIREANQMRLA